MTVSAKAWAESMRVPKKVWYQASPTKLVMADDCGRAHAYRYRDKLRVKNERRSPTLASGSAVAYAVETWLADQSKLMPTEDDLEKLVMEGLAKEFAGYEQDEGAQLMRKFGPGVRRAVTRIPDWMWGGEWYVEKEVTGTFQDDEIGVTVKGRLDQMKFTEEEGVPTIELIDVKTTDTDPLEYVLWTPQLRIYAACLAQMYPERLICYRYVCVPTTPSGKAKVGAEIVFTAAANANTTREILAMARKLGAGDAPRYARRCQWCAYQKICSTIITGGDPKDVIRELFVKRGEEDGNHSEAEREATPVG